MARPLIIICGSTGTGKTALATYLAQRFPCEIISADSRQVYKYMDIGTGKATSKERSLAVHHLVDTVDPSKVYSAADFVREAIPIIESLWEKGKVPIIEGGTGFYITALIDGVESLGVPPNYDLRKDLSKLSTEFLFERLRQIDPKRARAIDRNNPRRLIRALEVATTRVKSKVPSCKMGELLYLGLTASRDFLYERSDERVKKAVEGGLIEEVKTLLEMGYDWSLPSMSSIWYLPIKPYLEGKINKQDLIKKLQHETHGYIRRQLTWFKKDPRITWFEVTDPHLYRKVEKQVKGFLRKNA